MRVLLHIYDLFSFEVSNNQEMQPGYILPLHLRFHVTLNIYKDVTFYPKIEKRS